MKNIFQVNTNNPYNFRSSSKLDCRNPKIVKYGTETISYLAPKIWSLVPEIVKSSKILDIVKNKINRNLIVLVVYVRLTCNMLVSFKFLRGIQHVRKFGHSALARTNRIYRMNYFLRK